MEVAVPDASVLLKWVLPSSDEEDYRQALQMRDMSIAGKLALKVPSLWLYEVGNVVSRRFPKDANEIIQALRSFGLEEAKSNKPWLDQCLRITQQYNVTFYDAAYHALALIEGALFVTADKKYALKTRSLGAVVSLQNWRM